jgi:hypothetical protein
MTEGRESRARSFGLFWILANIVGWALFVGFAFAAGWLVWALYEQGGYPRLLHSEETRVLLAFVVAGSGWGSILGWLQQLVLKRRLRLEGNRWIWATLIGVVLYTLFDVVLSLLLMAVPFHRSSYSLLHGLVAVVPPLALGVAQWYMLRRSLARAGWWVLAVVLGLWLPGIAFSLLASGPSPRVSMLTSPFVEGAAYGVATLVVLAVLPQETADAGLAD